MKRLFLISLIGLFSLSALAMDEISEVGIQTLSTEFVKGSTTEKETFLVVKACLLANCQIDQEVPTGIIVEKSEAWGPNETVTTQYLYKVKVKSQHLLTQIRNYQKEQYTTGQRAYSLIIQDSVLKEIRLISHD